ncbi:MAG: carboxylating nicotinate-nucleotide diphosphorylase [Planctomycetes bacterium]|nr:carboxylating nicotinate-nucleotide diphosphorylase [Planctomycetota bacterium]
MKMNSSENKNARELIRMGIREDIGRGDITSNLLFPPSLKCRALIKTNQHGMLAGAAVAEMAFKAIDKNLKVKLLKMDGDHLHEQDIVLEVSGNARSILTAERLALNFLSRLSGIATLTHHYFHEIMDSGAQILDTRKTAPGWRALEKFAVRCGRGVNHRMGLYDGILIKDNHLALVQANSGLKELQKKIRKFKSTNEKTFVEIEVQNDKQLDWALACRPDIIMLDNYRPEGAENAARKIRNRKYRKIFVEISGGITLGNIREYAKTGVDRISVGALTHSAQILNFSMDIKKMEKGK